MGNQSINIAQYCIDFPVGAPSVFTRRDPCTILVQISNCTCIHRPEGRWLVGAE